ncbi:MAG: DUF2171 domain-containing protein [Rhizobiales bacterium]|jgi:hypothetical protein|nr:DUF2171 domain-containing protein [Hyphomicrobiales bacterium]
MAESDRIQAHMLVLDQRGNHVGTVDRVDEAGEIRLARSDSPDGLHHYIPLDWVEAVDEAVRLNRVSSSVLRDRD